MVGVSLAVTAVCIIVAVSVLRGPSLEEYGLKAGEPIPGPQELWVVVLDHRNHVAERLELPDRKAWVKPKVLKGLLVKATGETPDSAGKLVWVDQPVIISDAAGKVIFSSSTVAKSSAAAVPIV